MSIRYRITAEVEFDDPGEVTLAALMDYVSDLPSDLTWDTLDARQWFQGMMIVPVGDFDKSARLPRLDAWR